VSAVSVEATSEDSMVAVSRGKRISFKIPEQNQESTTMMPPEVFLSSLGFCIGIYVKRYCTKNNIPFKGFKVIVHSKSGFEPSRIAKIDSQMEMPEPLSAEQRDGVLNAATKCYLSNTLSQPPQISFQLK